MHAPRSADREGAYRAPAVRALRDAAILFVPFRRSESALGGGLRRRAFHAGCFLRWPIPSARLIPPPGRCRVVGCEKWSEAARKIVEASRSLVATFVLHSENSTHHARQPLPIRCIVRKMLASLFCNRIELGLAVVR